MAEYPTTQESRFGKEWIMFGQNPGLKTLDLIDFQKKNLPGIAVLSGISVGASFFVNFLSHNQIESNQADPQTVIAGNITEDIDKLNRELLKLIPIGQFAAVRSSALDERGGTGIYSSEFIVFTGDPEQDLTMLWQVEKSIYASYFSADALLYREHISRPQNVGMGLLIQPVIGNQLEGANDLFAPVLSGVINEDDGEMQFRVVLGLGTRAVNVKEAVVLKGYEYSLQEILARQLESLDRADIIGTQFENNIFNGYFVHKTNLLKNAQAQLHKIDILRETWQQEKKKGINHYWEFAIDQSDNPPHIVQSAIDEPTPQTVIEFEHPEGTVLIEGDDIVNKGIIKGKGIIMLGPEVDPSDLSYLIGFNEQSKDYLLILKDALFSKLTKSKTDSFLSFKHFSNAAAIIELQYIREEERSASINPVVSHVNKRGGSHFAELCKKRHILFLGCPILEETRNHLVETLGKTTDRFGEHGKFWDGAFKIINLKDTGRAELLSIPTQRTYLWKDVFEWNQKLHSVAFMLGKTDEDDEMFGGTSESFYETAYCLDEALKGGIIGFDPFRTVEKVKVEEIPQLVSHIRIVLDKLWDLDSEYEDWERFGDEEYPLVGYLKELTQRLEQKMASQ